MEPMTDEDYEPAYTRDDELDALVQRRGWFSFRGTEHEVAGEDTWRYQNGRGAIVLSPLATGGFEVSYLEDGQLIFEPQVEDIPLGGTREAFLVMLEAAVTFEP
jgi:hypothetical protein